MGALPVDLAPPRGGVAGARAALAAVAARRGFAHNPLPECTINAATGHLIDAILEQAEGSLADADLQELVDATVNRIRFAVMARR